MTCPLHYLANRSLADDSVSGGFVNSPAGMTLLKSAAKKMLKGVNPLEGEDADEMRALLDTPVRVQDERVRKHLDEIIGAAQRNGTKAQEIVGGFGGVRVEDGKQSLIFVPAADVSKVVDGFVVNEQERTLTVQMTDEYGVQHVRTYVNVPPEAMISLVAAATLKRVKKLKSPQRYALATLRLLNELGGGELADAAILRTVRRPSVDNVYHDFIEELPHTTKMVVGSCPEGISLRSCIKRRRKLFAFEYHNGLHVNMSKLKDDAQKLKDKIQRRERRKQAIETYEDVMHKIKRYYWDDSTAYDVITTLCNLLKSNSLPREYRRDVLYELGRHTDWPDPDIAPAAMRYMAELINGRYLTKKEEESARWHLLDALSNENAHNRFDALYCLLDIDLSEKEKRQILRELWDNATGGYEMPDTTSWDREALRADFKDEFEKLSKRWGIDLKS